MADRILFVDDDPNLLAAFQRNLRKQFVFDTALGAVEALRLIQSDGPYAVVVADMNMPGMNGIELLERVQAASPDSVRLMLTGNADQQTAVDAVNRGAVFRFLNKPCPPEELTRAVEAALKQHELQRLERELLEGTVSGSVRMLTDVLGMVASDALGRGQLLRESMHRIIAATGAGPAWELELSATLSNIGYAIVPPPILRKLANGAELMPRERAIVRHAPQAGHDLLAGIPRFQGVARNILYQAAHYDGSGFPDDGLAGHHLPLGARLLKILNDRLDLEADGVVKTRALDAMRSRKGHYDPVLLEQCFGCMADFMATAITKDRPVLALQIRQLTPGDVVVSDLTIREGLILIRAGSTLTGMMIRRLANFAELGEVQEPVLVQRPASPLPCAAPAA
ncbi:MAG: HD domain-containing phosphohydrolase [Verrucomicrobiota bacterium]